jgi:putative membrane protein
MPERLLRNPLKKSSASQQRKSPFHAMCLRGASIVAITSSAGFLPLAHAQGVHDAPPASAVEQGGMAAGAGKALSPADQQFMDKAGQAGATEIALSTLALSRSSDAQVKRFAQQMISDHTRLARNLDVIAKRHDITEPATADASIVGSLQNLQGSEFDKAYIEKALEGHRKAVELFRNESESGSDALLKSAAARALPIITHHYTMAQQLAKAKAVAS